MKVWLQRWEESEDNWGTRPDGCSMHVSKADAKAFESNYWAGMPSSVPEVYSRPEGAPFRADVDAETFAKVKAAHLGLRVFGRQFSR